MRSTSWASTAAGDEALGDRLLQQEPRVFPRNAHGFNSVHGRMPSVATGALLANQHAGDRRQRRRRHRRIGIGQFVHLMRRNLPLIYIIEDNGCYGLTKGQFSPTADSGSKPKNGVVNDLPPIDTCLLAIELGASFVARSFSGDKKQLLTLLKAAISHRGTACSTSSARASPSTTTRARPRATAT